MNLNRKKKQTEHIKMNFEFSFENFENVLSTFLCLPTMRICFDCQNNSRFKVNVKLFSLIKI